MKLSRGLNLFFLASFLIVTLGHCKNLESKHVQEKEGRRIGNFVEFKGEGDQLAVESTNTEDVENVASTSTLAGGKREILGTRKVVDATEQETDANTSVATTGRQCPNVNKVLLPIIPVIIASLIGLIGAIIISAIARGVYRLIKENHSGMDESGYGYERRRYGSFSNFFGFDMSKVDYLGLTKRIFKAIEKVY